jgi:hypothetical protein
MASGGSHDLVLLDVVLPGLGGFAVLDELRRVSDIPVLMLTARGEPSDRVFGLSAGATVSQPFVLQSSSRGSCHSPAVGWAGARESPSSRSGVCPTPRPGRSAWRVQVDLTSADTES